MTCTRKNVRLGVPSKNAGKRWRLQRCRAISWLVTKRKTGAGSKQDAGEVSSPSASSESWEKQGSRVSETGEVSLTRFLFFFFFFSDHGFVCTKLCHLISAIFSVRFALPLAWIIVAQFLVGVVVFLLGELGLGILQHCYHRTWLGQAHLP